MNKVTYLILDYKDLQAGADSEMLRNGKNLYPVSPGDPGEFAVRITATAADTELLIRMSGRNKELVEAHIDLNDSGREFMKLVKATARRRQK